jgi:UDP-glucose 4-epimerase
VLVTGACGFIGANLVPRLLRAGLIVQGLDNLTRGSRAYLADEDVELVEADIRDRAAVTQSLAGVDAVVHLAAFGSVTDSIAEPFENFDVNVRGTLVVLDACVAAGVEQVVFASTGGAALGNAPPPVDEETLPRPISPYGAGKVAGEAYCHAYAGAFGLATTALRFANVYGPFSAHKRGAATSFIVRALQGEPLLVYGDGSATRDFLYVDDVCDGIVATLERRFADDVFHLASGVETSIAELAQLVLELTGADVSIEHAPARRGEVERNFARSSRAAEAFGFEPRYSLREGLERTVEWFARRPAEARSSAAARP